MTIIMEKMPFQSSTLFLGDLSMYVTEKDIFILFERFGPIESIILKKNNQHCYGFLCFKDPRSAEIGLRSMNGTILHGRKMRVNWASDYRFVAHQQHPFPANSQNSGASAQVHVSFRSSQRLVTEDFLKSIFSRFGEVTDVAIKRSNFQQGNKTFAGFGFVHYPLNPEGINAALEACRRLNHVQVDLVVLSCTMSHGLQEFIQTNPKSPAPGMNMGGIPPALTHELPGMGMKPFPSTGLPTMIPGSMSSSAHLQHSFPPQNLEISTHNPFLPREHLTHSLPALGGNGSGMPFGMGSSSHSPPPAYQGSMMLNGSGTSPLASFNGGGGLSGLTSTSPTSSSPPNGLANVSVSMTSSHSSMVASSSFHSSVSSSLPHQQNPNHNNSSNSLFTTTTTQNNPFDGSEQMPLLF